MVVSEPGREEGVARGDGVEVLVGGRWPVRLEPGVKGAAIYVNLCLHFEIYLLKYEVGYKKNSLLLLLLS